MTTEEMSREFDLYVKQLMPAGDVNTQFGYTTPQFNEYEKSVLLTQAQKSIYKSFVFGEEVVSIDGNAVSRVGFSPLTKTVSNAMVDNPVDLPVNANIYQYSVQYRNDVVQVLSEMVRHDQGTCRVQPLRHDEESVYLDNPFRKPNKDKCFRIEDGTLSPKSLVLLTDRVLQNPQYVYTYIRMPKPIVLVNFTNALVSIDGETQKCDSELSPLFHMEIVIFAARYAVSKYLSLHNNSNNKS